MTFGPVYLYQIGIPIPYIFLSWAGYAFFSSVFRLIVFQFIHRLGLRQCVFIGSVFFSGLYPVLGLVDGVNGWLLFYMLYFSVGESFYWLAYHVYFALLGEAEFRGRHTGFRQVLIHLGSILAPLLTVFLVEQYNFQTVFFVAAFFNILGLMPLLYAKNIAVKKPISFKRAWTSISKKGAGLYSGISIMRMAIDFTWGLVVYFILGDIVSFGLAISISVAISALIQYFVGHSFDKNKFPHLYLVGAVLLCATIITATYFASTMATIIAINVCYRVANSFFEPYVNIIVYNSSKKSPDPLWFQLFSDTTYHASTVVSSLLIIALFLLGVDLQHTMVLGVFGILLTAFFIYREQ